MTWFMVNMARFPDVADKLAEELEQHLPDSASIASSFSSSILDQMSYLDKVIHESNRFSPPVAGNGPRLLKADTQIGDYMIKAGVCISFALAPPFLPLLPSPSHFQTSVGVFTADVHFNPKVWGPDALEFRPDRWNPENPAAQNPYAYTIFGAGRRSCLGNPPRPSLLDVSSFFLLLLLPLLLSLIVSSFSISPSFFSVSFQADSLPTSRCASSSLSSCATSALA